MLPHGMSILLTLESSPGAIHDSMHLPQMLSLQCSHSHPLAGWLARLARNNRSLRRCGILISGKAMFHPPHIELELHNALRLKRPIQTFT